MEVKNLPEIILMFVMVGMIIGVGIMTFGKFGDAAVESVTILDESLTWPSLNGNMTLAHGNLTSFSQIVNTTGSVYPAANYSIDLTSGRIQIGINDSALLPCGTVADTCTADYVYDEYDTATKTAMSATSTAVGTISSTWLGLIVTILALAIVLGLVIKGFANRR